MTSKTIERDRQRTSDGTGQQRQRSKPTTTDWLRIILPVAMIVAFIVVAWRLGYFDLEHPQMLAKAANRAQGVPWLGPIFVAVYAGMATLAVPISPLAYAAGAVFGFGKGSLYVWIASVIGASAGYLLARTAWAGPARRLLGRYETKLRRMRKSNAFLTTFRMQVLPVVPFGVFNYAAAISGLSFVPFLIGSALGVIPGTIAAVFVGDRIAAGLHGDRQPLVIAAIVGAGLLVLSFAPTVMKKLRR